MICGASMSVCLCYVFFFKQKTAYEMRISDWSSDVCSSDLIFTQLMAYNMKKKSNRDDLIDSCAYGQQMIDNYLGIIMEQARGVQNFEATAKRGLEVANV